LTKIKRLKGRLLPKTIFKIWNPELLDSRRGKSPYMTGIISASLTLFSIQVGFPVAGILIGDYFLKNQKDKKIRYALGISVFAFGGWLLSNHITTRYLEDVEITLEAEA